SQRYSRISKMTRVPDGVLGSMIGSASVAVARASGTSSIAMGASRPAAYTRSPREVNRGAGARRRQHRAVARIKALGDRTRTSAPIDDRVGSAQATPMLRWSHADAVRVSLRSMVASLVVALAANATLASAAPC